MANLHLCFDGNFINESYSVFERYYPNENFFLVQELGSKLKFVKENEKIKAFSFKKKDFPMIFQYCKANSVDKIVLHGLSFPYFNFLKYATPIFNFKVYWIFWGFELYISLAQLGKYDLVDDHVNILSLQTYMYPNKYNLYLRKIFRKKIISDVLIKTIPYIDYFCFWNYKDYELLQKHFQTDIQFKFFAYTSIDRPKTEIEKKNIWQKKEKTIMINHQASITGNHNTIMKKISKIDKDNIYEKIVPLSYGSSYMKKMILKKGIKLFGNRFKPILQYLPKKDYFNIIEHTEVAIIGAKRQEAAGNISHLLKNGVKVFLREDNNLLDYYKKMGYFIFSFEENLNSLEDLSPLTLEQQKHNNNCHLRTRLYNDQFMKSFFDE